jgi:hypothetical protein
VSNASLSGLPASTEVTPVSAGEYRIVPAPSSPIRVAIAAPGYLRRETALSGTNDQPTVDLIEDAAPFQLDRYREIVRNGRDAPQNVATIGTRRWNQDPTMYIVRVTLDTHRDVGDDVVRFMVETVRSVVPDFTGGRYKLGAVETGTMQRPLADGFFEVRLYDKCIPAAGGGTNLGEATAPPNSYLALAIDCFARLPNTPPPKFPEASTTTHEAGHAMGLFHHNGPGVMNPSGGAQITDEERMYARILYSRPRGNLDPDIDPPGFGGFLLNGRK